MLTGTDILILLWVLPVTRCGNLAKVIIESFDIKFDNLRISIEWGEPKNHFFSISNLLC